MNSVNIEDKAVLWQGDLEMLSYGGGVNTVAMTHRLVNEGWRGAIVMADTGGERPETYCHVAWMDEWLKTRGLHIERVACSMPPADLVERAAKSISDRRMLGQTLEGFCLPARVIPLLAVRWCSLNFKRVLLEAYRQEHGIATTLVGISADEPSRVRDDPAVCYPLVQWGWTRRDCLDYIKAQGVPIPPKSSCFFCPSASLNERRWLYTEHPDLYRRASKLEENASFFRNKRATLDPQGRWTLNELAERFEAEIPMEGFEELDMRAYEPCICGL